MEQAGPDLAARAEALRACRVWELRSALGLTAAGEEESEASEAGAILLAEADHDAHVLCANVATLCEWLGKAGG